MNPISNMDETIEQLLAKHTYDKESNGWEDAPNVDKPDLELIGDQTKLINEVAAVNPNTAVVLINGSYPGSGNHGVAEYKEGIFVGYRYFDEEKIAPRYPFGFGLSYTSFEYSDMKIDKCRCEDEFVVSFGVKNIGDREGAEIAQLYVNDQDCSLPRPLKELKGFEKVFLKPGEGKSISILFDKIAFAYFDEEKGDWIVEAGKFNIFVGSSSRDITLTGEINLD